MSHQTHDSVPILLNPSEQANLGKYIRGCEVDQVQAKYYEDQFLECANDLNNRPDLFTVTMSYIMAAVLGYVIGANH